MTDVAAVRERIAQHLDDGDVDAAFSALAPSTDARDRDRDVALLWLELLRAVPRHASFDGTIDAIERGFVADAMIAVAVAATHIARAELRPKDEPFEEVHDAEAALRALDAAPSATSGMRLDLETDRVTGRAHALARANALRLAGRARDADAVEAFEAARALAPTDPDVRFDAGLLHKWRGRWREAFDANRDALSLGRDDRGVRWNLALAAIALGHGETAAECFEALGLPVTLNGAKMPLIEGLTAVEVRVPSRGAGYGGQDVADAALAFEIVSVAPLSPCHGVVQSPTLRDAAVDYGDMVLWDGAVSSVRKTADGVLVPRFALLEILRRGDEHRFRFIALEQSAGDVETIGAALEEAFGERAQIFPLETRIEVVCPQCAAGDALVRHEHLPAQEHRLVHGKLVVSSEADLHALAACVESTTRASGRVKLAIPALYEALGDARRAGVEHQAYRGIERVGLRRSVTPSKS